jgi:hypothetical protein
MKFCRSIILCLARTANSFLKGRMLGSPALKSKRMRWTGLSASMKETGIVWEMVVKHLGR